MPKCSCRPGNGAKKTWFYTCPLCGKAGAHKAPKPELPVAKSPVFACQSNTAWSTPLVSIAAGCHPSQAKEFNELARKHGLTGVYYNQRGECEFSSRRQRREWNEIRGLHDKDGGYSD